MPVQLPKRPGCPNAPGGHRPLPDPAAVRLYLVPDSAPLYDDEVPSGEPDRGRETSSGPAAGEPAAGRPVKGRPVEGRPVEGRPVRGGPATATAPAWPSRFAQVLAETLAGSRPPRQIEPWTTQQAREHIHRLGPRMASVQRPRIRRVVTHRPASDVMEMAVVVGFGPRVRALAVRLERSASCPPAGPGGSAGPGAPVGRGKPTVSDGLPGPGEPADHGEPAGRWVCTAVEAA
jgi:hypothetical protein